MGLTKQASRNGLEGTRFARLVLGLLLAVSDAWGGSIEPYRGEMTDHDFPAFRVKEAVALPGPGSYRALPWFSTRFDGATLSILAELTPQSGCDRSVCISEWDGFAWLHQYLPAGRYTVRSGYRIGQEETWLSTAPFEIHTEIGACGSGVATNAVSITADGFSSRDRIVRAVEQPASAPDLFALLQRPQRVGYASPYDASVSLHYHPLDNTRVIADQIISRRTEAGILGAQDGNGLACFLPRSPNPLSIVEYYNSVLKHYFMTADPVEIAAIDRGAAEPGWVRTGEVIQGAAEEYCNQQYGLSAVYRFYGTPGIGPNSHFYTASRAECGWVRTDPGWLFEGLAFQVYTPTAGVCPGSSLPIHRLYNGRAAENDSNHRYTDKKEVVDHMRAQGWQYEGVTLCLPQLGRR